MVYRLVVPNGVRYKVLMPLRCVVTSVEVTGVWNLYWVVWILWGGTNMNMC